MVLDVGDAPQDIRAVIILGILDPSNSGCFMEDIAR